MQSILQTARDCCECGLDGPVVKSVPLILDDLVPHGDEDPGVQRRVRVAALSQALIRHDVCGTRVSNYTCLHSRASQRHTCEYKLMGVMVCMSHNNMWEMIHVLYTWRLQHIN